MVEKVLAAINRFTMFENEKRVTVALSGGADSVSLLYCLLEIKDELGLEISAAHLNHNIRGQEALRDEKFVKDLCCRLKVPLTVGSADVLKQAQQNRESVELAARRIRYDFLEKSADGLVALAHNANDNLETMLFNLTRGSAISGLCGIPAKREKFVRPLILCTRQEIEQFCKERHIEYVTDSTNLSDDYTRNKIRHNVIPILKQINPSAELAAARTAEFLQTDNDCLNRLADDAYLCAVDESGISAAKLSGYHKAVITRVFKRYYEEKFSAKLESSHLSLLCKMLCTGGAVMLPQSVKAEIQNGVVIMEKCGDKEKISFKTEIFKENIKKVNSLLFKNAIDCDKIVGKLELRARAPGDKIRLAGRGVSKTLKKLYNEFKIPENERENLPVASDQEGVVWILGIGIAERVKPDGATKNVIVFDSKRENI